MAEAEELKNMVLSFRVSELQMLLGFAGRNKTGRKNELQARALELIRLKSTPIQVKIRELYRSIQQGHAAALQQQQQQQQSSSTPSPEINANMQPRTAPTYNPSSYPSMASERALQGRHPYTPSYSSYTAPKVQQASPNAHSAYPVHPDVRFRSLPFYDVLGEIHKPSSLLPQGTGKYQEATFSFHLTPSQANEISTCRDLRPDSRVEYHVQVQLRFCLLETSCEQEDNFPPSICVKVNGKVCALPNPPPTNKPGVEPKRPPRPVNITGYLRISPMCTNTITVSWASELGRGYAVAVYLVRKLSSSDLLSRLKSRGTRHSDYTRGLIKEKLNEDADSEIATTSLRVSLSCPLGKMRMQIPCRAKTCNHLQCFDAAIYLQMNERKPTWICPVCDKPAFYEQLVIDGYFLDVLGSSALATGGTEIQLHQDGSWTPLVIIKKEGGGASLASVPVVQAKPPPTQQAPPQVQTVTDEPEPVKKPDDKKAVVIDLTLSDSDDEEGPTPKKKAIAGSGDAPVAQRSIADSTSGTNGPFTLPSAAVRSVSPHIITLDSPSPPPPSLPPPAARPVIPPGPPSGVYPLTSPPTMGVPHSVYPNMFPTFLDLDSDSNGSRPGSANPSYTRY